MNQGNRGAPATVEAKGATVCELGDRGADLHVHTTHSDGGCSPGEIVRAAASVGLRAVAITDHDTLSGIECAAGEAERLGVELVAGIELSAAYESREIHVLGHFVRAADRNLAAACADLKAARRGRVLEMIDRLAGFGLSVDLSALERDFPRATLGRKHLADWLVRTGQVESRRYVFAQFLGASGPAHVRKPLIGAAGAISLIKAAGGVAGLAHPPYDLRRSALDDLVRAGLRAIEVAGPSISSRLSRRFHEWADEFGLIPIAGSDFHSSDRPGRWVGSITTPIPEFERLKTVRELDEGPRNDRARPLGIPSAATSAR
jgi:predicted metal-dependent phosphoesterase TrpH